MSCLCLLSPPGASERWPWPPFLFVCFFNFYCYSITVLCLFYPSFHPTPAEPTSLPTLTTFALCPANQTRIPLPCRPCSTGFCALAPIVIVTQSFRFPFCLASVCQSLRHSPYLIYFTYCVPRPTALLCALFLNCHWRASLQDLDSARPGEILTGRLAAASLVAVSWE